MAPSIVREKFRQSMKTRPAAAVFVDQHGTHCKNVGLIAALLTGSRVETNGLVACVQSVNIYSLLPYIAKEREGYADNSIQADSCQINIHTNTISTLCICHPLILIEYISYDRVASNSSILFTF